ERLEQLLRLTALRPAGRLDARSTAERVDLDTGVLAEHPFVRRGGRPAEPSLDPRVLEVCSTVLRRIGVCGQRLELPPGQGGARLWPDFSSMTRPCSSGRSRSNTL